MRYAIVSPAEKKFAEDYDRRMHSVMLETQSGVKYFSGDKQNDEWSNKRSSRMFSTDRQNGGKLENHIPQSSTHYVTEIGEYSGANKAKVDFLLDKFGYKIPDESELAL